MTYLKPALTAALLTLSAPALAQSGDPTARVIEITLDDLPDIQEVLIDLEDAPERGWIIWSDRSDVEDDLNEYLDLIIEQILGEDYATARADLFDLDTRLARVEAELDELRVDLLTAPRSEAVFDTTDTLMMREYAAGSVEAIQIEMEELEVRKDALIASRAALQRGFRQTLNETYDLDLTREQSQSLLYQINGSSIVETMVTFRVLERIEARLAEIRSTVVSDDSLRNYYGVAATMRLITVRLHQRHLSDYDDVWLPALAELEADNAALIAATIDAVEADPSEARQAAYENNLAIQRQIADVITDYRALLMARRDETYARMQEATLDAQVAVNTLRTLQSAAILFEQVTIASEEFAALTSISDAQLIPLDDQEIFENYLDISRQLEARD